MVARDCYTCLTQAGLKMEKIKHAGKFERPILSYFQLGAGLILLFFHACDEACDLGIFNHLAK